MSQYIVSARKYRPDSFGTLIGQDNIAQTLKNSILRGQLAHAYLFCGPRGVGKTTTARIFAKMINCSNPSGDMEPCGTCESCLSFAEGRSYCIHELDAASNNGVEDIKTLMDQVRIPPQVGRYSVYIIDEVHMLSQSAFNAFLKTLEEPPAHAIFILATTEKHKILPTILSRCQTYDFNRITIENIVRNLRMVASSENITIDDESLHVIAHKADGAMRDALTIFDQTVAFCGTDVKYQDVLRNLNVLDYEYSFSLVDAFLKGDYPAALLAFDEILTKGFNALHFVAALSSHLRDLIVSKSGGLEALLELPDSLKAKYKEQSDRCTLPFLYEALNITTTCESGYRASVNPRLHIEFTLMRLSFILTKLQTPAVQPAAPVQPASPAAPQAQPTPAAAPVQPVPAAPAKPAPVPTEPVPAAAPAPAQPQRRERAARPGAAAASMKTLMDKEPEVKNEVDTGAAPSEEFLKARWPELAKEYASKPRMASMLSTTSLKVEGDDAKRTVIFMVDNEAQKDWVESKLLHDLEGKYQRIVGSPRIALRVDVTPHEEVKPLAYMPEDKAKELMAENDEVKSLVKDLGLDIK
ncbi:MAG: DNA polymerase III subunit gamma/tau [Bacteroidales bacterium]|nr:DNA polymerase III subunit gamma/tau [Bacteroidales bacterium]